MITIIILLILLVFENSISTYVSSPPTSRPSSHPTFGDQHLESITFTYKGVPQYYIVPAGIEALSVEAYGSSGGGGYDGGYHYYYYYYYY